MKALNILLQYQLINLYKITRYTLSDSRIQCKNCLALSLNQKKMKRYEIEQLMLFIKTYQASFHL